MYFFIVFIKYVEDYTRQLNMNDQFEWDEIPNYRYI